MSGTVLSWPRPTPLTNGWTNEELAELYRVEHSLAQAGLVVETERGVSDEGDPWFVFCHPDGRVVVHAARIDGLYRLHCAALPAPLTGQSFGAIAKAFVATLARTQSSGQPGRVVAHPSALLSLLVAAAMLSVDAVLHGSARACELSPAHLNHPRIPDLPSVPDLGHSPTKQTIAKEFVDLFFGAVWRSPETSGQREALWQAVEDAAVGLCALSAALYLPSAPLEANETGLTQDTPTVPDGAAAHGDNAGSSAGAGASGVHLQMDAATENAVESVSAPTNSPPTPFHAIVEARTDFVSARTPFYSDGGENWPETGIPAPRGLEDLHVFPSVSERGASSAYTTSPTNELGAQLDISIPPGGESIDLGGYPPGSVSIFIASGGGLTLTHAAALRSLEVGANVNAVLTLTYDATQPTAAPVEQTVRLDGGDNVSIAPTLSPAGPPQPLTITIESQGAQFNTLTLIDPHTDSTAQLNDLSIKVTGSQDLVLNESADYATSSKLDASSLTGKLSIGIDAGGAAATITDLSLSAGHFTVSPQDTVAIENLAGAPRIQLGIDLQTVLFGFGEDPSASGPITLGVGLGSTTGPVKIGVLEAQDVNSLAVTSNNGDSAVHVIDDHAIQNLTLSGSTSVEIDSIQGITAQDLQDIHIDAVNLSGNLTLDASAIPDTVAGGRLVTIATGGGVSFITDHNPTERLNVTIGSGQAFVNIAGGAEQASIAGLKSIDHVNIGSGNIMDQFTNGMAALAPHQGEIDSSGDLAAAATLAATMTEASAAHQALLFSYQGSTYVFVDVAGNHIFDPSADAIVKVVGVASTTDLSGIFHSN